MHINVYTTFYTSHYILSYLFQLVYGQCFLSVGLTQFQNLYSLEIPYLGKELVCCCDAVPCYYNANQFSMDTCESFCDTNFVLSFSECQDLPSCSVTMTTDISGNSDITTNVNYDFHFIVSSSAIEQV